MRKDTIQEIAQIESDKERMLRYLFVKSASVLAGVKPAVLVRYTVREKLIALTDYNLFTSHQEEIYQTLGLSRIVLKKSSTDLQILFYDKEKLKNYLESSPAAEFLQKQGYDTSTTLEEKLELLKERFTSDSFPHEIGLFLGYPLKDVKGFTEGRKDYLRIQKSMWQVFDTAAESLQKMALFRKAERVACHVAVRYENTVTCIEQLKNFAGALTRTA